VLDEADAVLTIGYDPIEYDPSIWNVNGKPQLNPLSKRFRTPSLRGKQ
jgi:hypothetical protein